jgi:hypothetical protein
MAHTSSSSGPGPSIPPGVMAFSPAFGATRLKTFAVEESMLKDLQAGRRCAGMGPGEGRPHVWFHPGKSAL